MTETTINESAAVPRWLTSWGLRAAPAVVKSGELDAMLASFLSVLDVRTRRATLSVTDEAKIAVLAEIRTSLNTFKDWFALTGRNPVEGWSWLPFYAALTSGLFGALFSRLLFLQSNWDNLTIGGLKAARDYTSIFLRGCVGMTGAVIVSFFLLSNVVGGGLFPAFSEIGLDTASYPNVEGSAPHLSLIYPSKSLALLVVWSFLAGFSERLVPSLLQDTETSIAKRTPSK